MKNYADYFAESPLSDEDAAFFKAATANLADGVEESLKFYLRFCGVINEKIMKEPDNPTHLVPTLLQLDFAEAIDGIEGLVRLGRGSAAKPLMRQAYEISVQLRYLTSDAASYPKKCRAYEYFHNKRETTNELIPLDKRERSKFLIELPHYGIIKEELDRMKLVNPKERVKAWYRLWNGPRSLEHMSKLFGENKEYLFYREWSWSIHGVAAVDRITESDRPTIGAKALRNPYEAVEIAMNAISLAVILTKHLVEFYSPLSVDVAREHLEKHVVPARSKIQNDWFELKET